MSLRLEEMNHSVYIDKDTYSYVELLQFYIDQQKLYTIEVNNLDLYQILLQYDVNIYHHMLDYHNYKNSIQEEMFHYSNFFVQPYHSYRETQFNQYFPSVYGFINLLYQRELILCNDIISVGDLYLPNKSGLIEKVTSLEELLKMDGVIDGEMFVNPGEYCEKKRVGNDASGWVQVSGVDEFDTLRKMQAVYDAFEIVSSDDIGGRKYVKKI